MLLMMVTEQVTVPPPPLPEPLHCVTEVTSASDSVIVVVQVGSAPAAPEHSMSVTVEEVAPVARSRLLVTVTVHSTARPPTLAVPLHWSTALTAWVVASVSSVSSAASRTWGPPQ